MRFTMQAAEVCTPSARSIRILDGGLPSTARNVMFSDSTFRQDAQFDVRAAVGPSASFDGRDDPKTERGAGFQQPIQDTAPHRSIGEHGLALLDHVGDGGAQGVHHVVWNALIPLA